jgi:hypothetical protein
MSIYRFTGHPFVDAGIAGIAAILKQKGRYIQSPEDISQADVFVAVDELLSLYSRRIARNESKKEEPAKVYPLCVPLLQEVLPGSSWDQAKGKPDNQIALFKKYVDDLVSGSAHPLQQQCFLTGAEAHVYVDKTRIPLLSSAQERPNCFPNLAGGFPASRWIALAVLFSPLGIEKTYKSDGKGSACLIYHSPNWHLMVSVANQNLRKIDILLAAKSIEEYGRQYFKGKSRSGTWKMALLTMWSALSRIDKSERPQVAIWNFNASNQSCRYQCIDVSPALLTIHDNRQLFPKVRGEVRSCSDEVSRLIIEGSPIVRQSIIEQGNRKRGVADRFDRIDLKPGWSFQRLYAEKVLHMPSRLLNAIEQAAHHLAQDNDAVNYCLYDRDKRISPYVLSYRYKLPGDIVAVLADHPRMWQDYLRAAVLWAAKGEEFGKSPAVDEPGPTEQLIKDVSQRLRIKHGYKRLAMRLSVGNIRRYRSEWIRLLSEGACTWEDFLAFNPLEEALSIGGYFRTRTLKDYLVAYLFGCSYASEPNREQEEEEEPESMDMSSEEEEE